MKSKNLEKYLWKGLNLDRYEPVQILPQNSKHAAIIMHTRDPSNDHWCIEYLGSGHYFCTVAEMQEYYQKKFNKTLDMGG